MKIKDLRIGDIFRPVEPHPLARESLVRRHYDRKLKSYICEAVSFNSIFEFEFDGDIEAERLKEV